jgi:hypothetical protein
VGGVLTAVQPILCAKDVFPGYGESANEQDARKPDKRGDEKGHPAQQLFAAENFITKFVGKQREGNGPPGHDGVEGSA